MRYGFVNVAAAVPMVKVADVAYNVEQIKSLITQADSQNVEVIVFPELCITGYTCQDLFKEQLLLDQAEQGIVQLLDFSRKLRRILRKTLVCFCSGFKPCRYLFCGKSDSCKC